MVERWGIGGIRVKFAPAASSRWLSSFTPRLRPTNGGAITTAVSPAAATITGTSSSNATGLYAHRSVTGRVGVRWEGGNEVRMGIQREDTPRWSVRWNAYERASGAPFGPVRRRPRGVDRARRGSGRATGGAALRRRHQG